MKRRQFLSMVAGGAAAGLARGVLPLRSEAAEPAGAGERPNVVLIISDDQAWTDYGFMGHPAIKTPHIDRLASQSLVLTRGYVPSALCRPSLATLSTGLYPHRHGIVGNDPKGGSRNLAGRREMVARFRRNALLPAMLGKAGYVSLQTGKWWEGHHTNGGFTAGMTHGDPKRGGRHGDAGLKIGRGGMKPIFDFIDGAGGRPFFLWYAPFMPHTPHSPPKRLLEKYTAADRPLPVARYYAMCEWFDETCGQLLGFLDKRKLAEKTVVIYVADNGWVQWAKKRRPLAQLRGKRTPYEMGVRTPIMVRWPGRVKPRRDEEQLASSIDIVPTILTACGLKPTKDMPGLNLLDAAAVSKRDAIFGEAFAHDVVDLVRPSSGLMHRWCIEGRWKLIVPHGQTTGPVELFDLKADPHEKTNLASKHPEKVAQLRKRIDGWWKVEG